MRRNRISPLILTFVLLLLSLFGPITANYLSQNKVTISSNAATPGSSAPDQILVKFKNGTPQNAVDELHKTLGTTVKKIIPKINVQIVTIPMNKTASEIIDAFKLNPTVQYAELDYIAHPAAVTNDPELKNQWALFKIQAASSSARSAWDITSSDPAIKVAILDSGIKEDHPDLQGKVVERANLGDSPTNSDLCSHGTAMASIVGASTNNRIGIAGAGYDTSLLNVKVSGNRNSDGNIDECSSDYGKIESGIIWATDNGAKVINISYGGTGFSESMEDATTYAWNHNTVIVASAGNSNSSTINYPAGNENVIAVAATDQSDQKATYSNYGSWITVAAPGESKVAYFTGSYSTATGTSGSSALTAGTTALVWSTGICQGQTRLPQNYCVRGLVEQYADRIAGTDTLWQYGRLNAYAAVTGDPSTLPEPTPTPTPRSDSKIYPRGDAYVDKNYPTRNFGTQLSLKTASSPYESSYIMFDLRPLAGKFIKSATFNIRVGSNPSADPQRLYTSSTSWEENTITYNNRPHTGSLLKSFYAKEAGAWIKIELTPLVTLYRGHLISLNIVNTGSDQATYYSRETHGKEYIEIKLERIAN